ncbi:MAG: class I tRNA ligase family protein, partial [Propionibacteriaceae bacterium]
MQSWTGSAVPELTPPDVALAAEPVRLHDSASKQLVPVGSESGAARLYVCGITPYDATHLGHANTYVAFDLLNRIWRDGGVDVTYVQNVTDIDDPLLERATANGVDWADLAAEQTDLFRTDMEALNVLPPEHFVGAVESIDLVVGLVKRLQGAGAIYPVDDSEFPDLYFARETDTEFGSLSHLSPDE